MSLISAVRDFLNVWNEGEADEVADAIRRLMVAYEENRLYQNERQRRAYHRRRGFSPAVDGIDYDSSDQGGGA